MDVDPLDKNRLLFVAGERTDSGEIQRVAVVINWRNNNELLKFPVPDDTHDVDAIGNGRFAVADIDNHTAYIVDTSNGDVTWRYDFKKHFDPATAGNAPVSGDWAHLYDIDLHSGGELVLLSPRNFDRVILLNRSTKEIVWTLGSEDDYSTLYEQHNPVLLDRSLPTVLVADSENNRIVEYRRRDGSWEQLWRYEGGLNWPRDADRLPNGNTLITDTHNDRVLEVTPSGETVWQHEIARGPYDIERLQYGDEPAGPSMASKDVPQAVGPAEERSSITEFVAPYETSYDKAYQVVGAWIIPEWAGQVSFLGLCFGALVVLVWLGIEFAVRLPIEPVMTESPPGSTRGTFLGGVLVLAGLGTLPLLVGLSAQTAVLATLSFVLVASGVQFVTRAASASWGLAGYRVLAVTVGLCSVAGVVLSLVLTATALTDIHAGASHVQVLCVFVALTALVGLWENRPTVRLAGRTASPANPNGE